MSRNSTSARKKSASGWNFLIPWPVQTNVTDPGEANCLKIPA
ncbi:hypothetical protein [Candidatus Chlorobium masyuteum]|nr:hypothetical protein [Candidatus Chlorobium masyuteum]